MTNTRQRFPILIVTLLLAALLLSSCRSIPTSRPIAPDVSVESVTPVKLGLSKQEISIELNIENPNTYDLPVKTLNFIASIDGTEFAQGISNESITIPALGTAIMEVLVSTRINKLLGKVLLSSSSGVDNIAYDVKGFVKLGNWPARIPFNVDGSVETPTLQ